MCYELLMLRTNNITLVHNIGQTHIDVGYHTIIYVHFSDETFGTNMYTCNIVAQFNTTSHLAGTVVQCLAISFSYTI